MVTIKSQILKRDNTYDPQSWRLLIQQINDELHTDNINEVLLEAKKYVLNQVFEDFAANKMDLEMQYGPIIFFDVIINEHLTNFDNCSYSVIYEILSNKDIQFLKLFEDNFASNVVPFNEKIQTKILKNIGYKSPEISREELLSLKKWYKQESYKDFFNELNNDFNKKIELVISDKSIERNFIDSKENTINEIKNLAFMGLVKLNYGLLTKREAESMFIYIASKIKYSNLAFETKEEKEDYIRDWINKVIYGKKMMAKEDSSLFRKILLS
ncbi:hypothetical protein [Mycoplasma sp. Mirounga ES2805-ORL]|uniref:hypothetical protein n=1 Tax=Mycoplasma sp. Mirounga ES2805-ORL TaxID=754514 RepID=UPI00197C58CD|nr:hypothetical protein [Mycoplasma sp. Mirounga ES2805-ORL]QSF13605.1 hypothetical protein JXZ90_02985 [Mycoplasma sp. Mirounga ES2805-ORL]